MAFDWAEFDRVLSRLGTFERSLQGNGVDHSHKVEVYQGTAIALLNSAQTCPLELVVVTEHHKGPVVYGRLETFPDALPSGIYALLELASQPDSWALAQVEAGKLYRSLSSIDFTSGVSIEGSLVARGLRGTFSRRMFVTDASRGHEEGIYLLPAQYEQGLEFFGTLRHDLVRTTFIEQTPSELPREIPK